MSRGPKRRPSPRVRYTRVEFSVALRERPEGRELVSLEALRRRRMRHLRRPITSNGDRD